MNDVTEQDSLKKKNDNQELIEEITILATPKFL